MKLEKLTSTKSGKMIYIDERTREHMLAHADVQISDIKEAIALIDDYNGKFMIKEIDLSRVIGKSACVEIGPDDNVRMLYRLNREGRTPIVFDREPSDTNYIVIGICHDKDGYDKLFTSWYGQLAEKEPWDKNIRTEEERKRSEMFWSTHAIIGDESSIDWVRSEA